MTDAQRRALELHWHCYGVEPQGMLDLDALFGRTAPAVLDIGFGNGDSLYHMAAADPSRDYLGIEVHRPGVGRLLQRLADNKITNVRVVCADAKEVLLHNLADNSLAAVYLFFPDPWPKKRHHKRRLVQQDFAELVLRRLEAGGRFHIATDWQDYADWIVEALAQVPGLDNIAGAAVYSARPDYRPPTKYEARGVRLGHVVRDLIYEKR